MEEFRIIGDEGYFYGELALVINKNLSATKRQQLENFLGEDRDSQERIKELEDEIEALAFELDTLKHG